MTYEERLAQLRAAEPLRAKAKEAVMASTITDSIDLTPTMEGYRQMLTMFETAADAGANAPVVASAKEIREYLATVDSDWLAGYDARKAL